MSLMPTLLIGIRRVSAWPCTSSTGSTLGFLTGTAVIFADSYEAIWSLMVPKPRIPRILDDSRRLGSSAAHPGQPTGGIDGRSVGTGSRRMHAAARRGTYRPSIRRFASAGRLEGLSAAIHDVRGQPSQDRSALAEQREPVAGAAMQLVRARLGGVEAQYAGVGGLGPGGVGADGLAEICDVAFDVENIVLDLKCESDVLRIPVQSVPFLHGQARRARRRQQHARPDQGAGLETMHGFEMFQIRSEEHTSELQSLAYL